eukprot:7401092-Pyramimonas_sp.AAC.1
MRWRHGARIACARNRPEALRRIVAAGARDLFRGTPRAIAAGFLARHGRARRGRAFARAVGCETPAAARRRSPLCEGASWMA